jgi:hypothetical protein
VRLHPSLKTITPFAVNKPTFTGTITQAGDTMTIVAAAGQKFTSATTVSFGAAAAIILSLSADSTTFRVLSPVSYTGVVTVTKALLGIATLSAIKSAGSYTMNAATFPAANVGVGAGRLGDTVTIIAPSGLSFSTTAGKLSQVTLGNTAITTSDTAWVVSRTATTIKAFAKRGGIAPVTVTNLVLGSSTLPYLSTPTNFTIDSVASDFPVATTQGAANVLTIPASDTAVMFGSVGPAGAAFWTFTTTAAHVLKGNLAWFGSGNPYGTAPNTVANTEDLDFLVCNAATKCDESGADLTGYAGATTAQPEAWVTTSLPAAQYWIGILGFNAGYSIVYKMTVILQ